MGVRLIHYSPTDLRGSEIVMPRGFLARISSGQCIAGLTISTR
jgi:hypothetical protein